MTPIKVMAAYKAIHELSVCVLPYKTARQVHKLRTKLTEEFDTVLNAEKTMVEKHGGKVQNGTYDFPSAEAGIAFKKEYDEFLQQEDDIVLPRVDATKCSDAIRISASAIEVLEGLVDFGEV